MAERYAFLFPGQGAQVPGMIRDVAEKYAGVKKIISEASEICGENLEHLIWEEEACVLSRSDKSQLAITTASVGLIEALKENGIQASCAMGFSLGEFPALYASGVLSLEQLFKIVQARGKIMQLVCEEIAAENSDHAPGMSAIIGLPCESVKEICDGLENVYAANMNSVKQTVISGTFEGLNTAEEKCKNAGARRTIRLSVAGPFHCPLMKKAADEFERFLESVEFNNPVLPVFSNVTGKEVLTGADAKKNAVLHLTQSVLWTDEEKNLAGLFEKNADDVWKIVEAGPGKVLSGLWKDTEFAQKFTCRPVNSLETLDGLLLGN